MEANLVARDLRFYKFGHWIMYFSHLRVSDSLQDTKIAKFSPLVETVGKGQRCEEHSRTHSLGLK